MTPFFETPLDCRKSVDTVIHKYGNLILLVTAHRPHQ